jgi:hypothetical protein
MALFIELTLLNGEVFIGNLDRLTLVTNTYDGSAVVVQFDGIDAIKVKETYEKIIEKINARTARVNRANW